MADHRLSDQERAARIEAARRDVEAAVEAIVTGENWQAWLGLQARLHCYSPNNTMWLLQQSIRRDEPLEAVAGYRAWQALGRQVRRGERGWSVLAPVTRRVRVDEEQEQQAPGKEDGVGEGAAARRVVGWRVETVFDVNQTDGEPLPAKPDPRCQRLDGSVDPALVEAIEAVIREAGCRVERVDADAEKWPATQNGRTDLLTRTVAVRAGMASAQEAKTLLHEAAHVALAHTTSDRRTEVEAESVAYVVLSGLGVNSAGYSFGYVAGWSGGDVGVVTAAAKSVTTTATDLSERVEAALEHARDRRRVVDDDDDDDDALALSLGSS